MTKSKGIGRGGHREGAGRPAIDKGKTANFATRITQTTRDLLDAEARRTGKSVAWVAERLLRSALDKKSAEMTRSEELRALFFLIEMLLWHTTGEHHWYDAQYSWQTNPYLFEALRRSISYLMNAMRPEGEVVPPPPGPERRFKDILGEDVVKQFKYPDSVDEYAKDAARQVVQRAQRQKDLEDAMVRHKSGTVTWDDIRLNWGTPSEEDDFVMRVDSALADAARALLDRGKK